MRILFTDIETTDLKALMGRVLCASFVLLGGPGDEEGPQPYTFRLDDKRFRSKSPVDDSKLVAAIRDEWESVDTIVTWNGKLFDVPMVNARLIKRKERPFRPHFHLDLMYYAKASSARIGSAKLVNVQKYLDVASAKTEISWETWQAAAAGDSKAMDEVVEHCEFDVVVLRQVYPYLLPLVRNLHR